MYPLRVLLLLFRFASFLPAGDNDNVGSGSGGDKDVAATDMIITIAVHLISTILSTSAIVCFQ